MPTAFSAHKPDSAQSGPAHRPDSTHSLGPAHKPEYTHSLAPPIDVILPTALDLSTSHLTLQGHKDTKHGSELLTVTREEVTGQDRGPQHWVLWILGAEDSEAVTLPLAQGRL